MNPVIFVIFMLERATAESQAAEALSCFLFG
jgi:hypothetical protein